MTGVPRSLMDIAARLLEQDERDAVLGDLAETGSNAWQSLVEVVGLVMRRQAALWADWRPWLAAFGVALPGSFLLMGVSFSIGCTYRRLASSTVCAACSPTGQEDLLLLACQVLLLIIWSWTGGFVVGSKSRRTLWVSALLCASPCLFCLTRFHEASLSRLCLLLFLPPAILGVRYGLRVTRIKPTSALALAMVVTALMIFASSNRALWLLNWVLIAPAWLIVAEARKGRTWQMDSRSP
jgi:hypothetical protein